jgi:hypothetical protein
MSRINTANLRNLRRSLVIQSVLLLLLVGAMIYYGYTLMGQAPIQYAWDETRDLSKPSGRLIGHWEMISEVPQDVQQYYFGSVDAEGKGITYLVLANGVFKEMVYRLTREVQGGQQIEFDCLTGTNVTREVKMNIPEHGQSATYEFQYFNKPQKRYMKYIGPQISP